MHLHRSLSLAKREAKKLKRALSDCGIKTSLHDSQTLIAKSYADKCHEKYVKLI